MTLSKQNLAFIQELANNNNRDWFNANKADYELNRNQVIAFADALLTRMNEHDVLETPSGKKSLFRIYRDVRFSKDKSPYKTHWSGSFKRASKYRRGGYYFHIEPGNQSFIAGGFWAPNKDDLARIREEIAQAPDELREIIQTKAFVDTFGSLQGEQLKSAPKGYDKEHPAIDLLRYKQFIVVKPFSDEEVLRSDFVEVVNAVFQKMRPFFDYMSEVLTTDANGEPIV